MTVADATLQLTRSQLSTFAPVLARLEEDCVTRLGIERPAFVVERVLSRHYSETLQLLVNSPAAEARRVFVKIARSDSNPAEREETSRRVAWAFETMARLYQAMAVAPGLSVVRPLACYPEHLAIVTEGARGVTLLHLLETRARWWPSRHTLQQLSHSVARIGEWMQQFQRVTSADTSSLSLSEMRAYIDDRLRLLVDIPKAAFSADDRRRLLNAFDAIAERVEADAIPSVLAHADFALGNVLVDGGDIVVLDFAAPARGARYHDVSHLFMQLDLLNAKPQFRPSVTRRLQEALLEGFDPGLRESEPLFQLLLFQHVACHYLGLARSSGGPAQRTFEWHLQRRHRRWLNRFAADAT